MGRVKPEDRLISPIPDYNGAGIYMIRNLVTGRMYIGSAEHIQNRIKVHDTAMRHGQCNQRFLDDIAKGHRFTCEVVEKCDNVMFVELRDREEYYVRKYDCYNSGYNMQCVPTYKLEYYKDKDVIEWLTRKV